MPDENDKQIARHIFESLSNKWLSKYNSGDNSMEIFTTFVVN